jgi:histone H3/H4
MSKETSKKVASKASKLLQDSKSKTVKSVAASALSQAEKAKKKK